MTQKEKDRVERKVNRAIDAMVDLQDMGLGRESIQRILDALNLLNTELQRDS